MVLRRLSLALGLALALGAGTALSADKPYSEGTVWTMSLIKVKPGMFDVYMRDLLPIRKKLDEEAKKEGLVLSTHILSGQASGNDDFDFVILEEFKNWAAFDGLTAKYDTLMDKLGQTEEKQTQAMEKRVEVRSIIGMKTFQEIVPK
ncbi:MAG TPA: hypothetical protein VKQ29_10490 [Aliidongia sp.]|nr:hypothetical protein [Aliidongia sp.]